MILICVKWPIKPEYADQWVELSREFTEATRAEPGNVFFDWSRSVDDPTHYVLVEGFQDDGAVAHVTSDHFKRPRPISRSTSRDAVHPQRAGPARGLGPARRDAGAGLGLSPAGSHIETLDLSRRAVCRPTLRDAT